MKLVTTKEFNFLGNLSQQFTMLKQLQWQQCDGIVTTPTALNIAQQAMAFTV